MSIQGYCDYKGVNHSRFSNSATLRKYDMIPVAGVIEPSLIQESEQLWFAYQSAGDLKPRGLVIDEDMDSISLTKKSETTDVILHYSKALEDFLQAPNKIVMAIKDREFEITSWENRGNNNVYLVLNLEKVTFGKAS